MKDTRSGTRSLDPHLPLVLFVLKSVVRDLTSVSHVMILLCSLVKSASLTLECYPSAPSRDFSTVHLTLDLLFTNSWTSLIISITDTFPVVTQTVSTPCR